MAILHIYKIVLRYRQRAVVVVLERLFTMCVICKFENGSAKDQYELDKTRHQYNRKHFNCYVFIC